MNETCNECGLKFEIEPGFFWGAMFFSYALTLIIVILSLVFYFLAIPTFPEWAAILIVAGLTLLFSPLNFRISRMLMLYLFGGVEYEGKAD